VGSRSATELERSVCIAEDSIVVRTVSFELQARGITGVLVKMAESGHITELRCLTPDCYCPGGRDYFDPMSASPDDWIPTADHFPLEKHQGGHLVPENVRLAHKKCNRLVSGKTPGHEKQRDKAKAEKEAWRLEHPRMKPSEAEALWVKAQRKAGLGGYEKDLSPEP
jgi:hypothetical protein